MWLDDIPSNPIRFHPVPDVFRWTPAESLTLRCWHLRHRKPGGDQYHAQLAGETNEDVNLGVPLFFGNTHIVRRYMCFPTAFEVPDVHCAFISSRYLHPSSLLGCPGQEVRINGDRINGIFHLSHKWSILGL